MEHLLAGLGIVIALTGLSALGIRRRRYRKLVRQAQEEVIAGRIEGVRLARSLFLLPPAEPRIRIVVDNSRSRDGAA
jgi:hypothetical protein